MNRRVCLSARERRLGLGGHSLGLGVIVHGGHGELAESGMRKVARTMRREL